MAFRIAPPAFFSLQTKEPIPGTFIIQSVDFQVESFRKAAPRCFPLAIICTLWDNSHRTSAVAIVPGEEAAWIDSAPSTHPCGWVPGCWRWSSSQQSFGFLHPSWVTSPPGYDSCLFWDIALKRSHNSGISSHRYCASGKQRGLLKTCFVFSGTEQGPIFWPNVLNSDATELSYL